MLTCLHKDTVSRATKAVSAGMLVSCEPGWMKHHKPKLDCRPEDAAGVEEAMQTAQGCNASLEGDVAAAQQALQRWQRTTNNEAKLAKALKEGASVAGLSRAIQVCQTKFGQSKQMHIQ
jgi:hypothetical protein